MARKNRNARPLKPAFRIPRNRHFAYSTDEFGADASIVRYLGEQDGNFLLCWHPEGYQLWIHVHQLTNPAKSARAA